MTVSSEQGELTAVLVVLEAVQVGTEAGDEDEPCDHGGEASRWAPGKAGGIADSVDEPLRRDPGAEATFAGEAGQRLELEKGLGEDELEVEAVESIELLEQPPQGVVGVDGDERRSSPALLVDEDRDESLARQAQATAGHQETSGSAAWTCSAVTALALPRAAAVRAWWARRFTLRGRPLVAWKMASSAGCSKRGNSVPASRRR